MNLHYNMHQHEILCTLTGALNLTHEEFHSRVSPTAISNVACVGTENELTDCSYSPLTTCGVLNDAGVVCQGNIML